MQKTLSLFLLIILGLTATAFPAAAAGNSTPDNTGFSLSTLLPKIITAASTWSREPASVATDLDFPGKFLENNSRDPEKHIRAGNNDWTLFADYQNIDSDPLSGMHTHDEIMDLKAQITEMGASYRFATWYETDFEILAGKRYTDEDNTSSLSAAVQNGNSANEEWWQNGYVGLRFSTRLTGNLTFIGRSDIGAAKDGHDPAWNAVAMVDYNPGDGTSFYLGYKILDFDVADADTDMELYSYDALRQGPFVGFSFRW